jgi:4-amino-4-deoxy-L-arabinose transferase-like glycosyltransferase
MFAVRFRLWHALGIVALLWAAIFLPGLGTPELKGEEGRRILPALSMLEFGDWVVPFMEGRPYVRKPPLINWAIATAVRLSGSRSEFVVRLPSALSVLVLAWAAMLFGRDAITGAGTGAARNRSALLLGIMTVTSVGLIEKGRLAEIEALYVALTGIAIGLWAFLWRAEASPWLTYTLPWFWLGLGLLCKGPPHLVFFYGIVAAVLHRNRSWRELLHPAHFLGLLIMTAVFAPWAWLCRARVGTLDPGLDVGGTWTDQVIHRLGFHQFDWKGWLLSPFEAVLMFFPWILPVLFFWRRFPAVAATLGPRDGALVLGMRTGVLVSGALILLVPETRARFVQPLALPVIFLGAWIVWHELPALWQKWWTRIALGAFAVLTFAGPVLPMFVSGPRASPYHALIAALFSLGAAAALWRIWVKVGRIAQPLRLALATAFAVCLLSVIAAATIWPAARRRDDMRPVGASITSHVAPHSLAIFNPGRNPDPLHWRFYLAVRHSVVGKLSAVPPDAEFLLIEETELDEGSNLRRVRENLGFLRNVARITDNEGRQFVLMTRLAEEAGSPEFPLIRRAPSTVK